jgi:hypothetical protein
MSASSELTPTVAALGVAENKCLDCIRVYYEIEREADGDTSWMMFFEGSYGISKFKFEVPFPDEHSVEDWEALAAGKRGLDCCESCAFGAIQIVGSDLVFGAAPSGRGNGVFLEVLIPLVVVAGPLRVAIRGAIAEGLRFAPPAPTVRA